jgi:hypothetical protein
VTKERPAVTSILQSETAKTPTDIRTEAAIVLRTVEHITFDLDYFSRTIRSKHHNTTVINDIERHLAQARRNCADATAIAERMEHLHRHHTEISARDIEKDTARLGDAFALLALADSAYLRAFEVASPR